jgi:hypothetical protein
MNKKSLTLLLAGIIGVASLTISVQAQTKQGVTPKFTSAKNGTFKLEGATKPFTPGGLGRSAKPNEGDSRGIPKPEGDERIPISIKNILRVVLGLLQVMKMNVVLQEKKMAFYYMIVPLLRVLRVVPLLG